MPTGFVVGNQWREVADTPAAGNFAAMTAWVSGAGIAWAGHATAVTAGAGALCKFAIGNSGGVTMVSDGTYWRPFNGRARLYGRNGQIAAPLATLTGITAGAFTLPETLTIPAALIAPHSEVWANFEFFRTGATATALVQWRLGTAGTTSDLVVYQASMAATTSHQSRGYSAAKFGTATDRFWAPNASNMNGGGSQASGADRTSNVNTAAAMQITADIASANAADTFLLLAYSVWLEG